MSFPRELTKHQVSYVKRWDDDEFKVNIDAEENLRRVLQITEGRVDGRFSVWDPVITAHFNDCFINPFVYEFCAEVPEYYCEQKAMISHKYMENEAINGFLDHDAKDHDLSEYWNKEWSLQNQVLYKYLQDNLKTGEFVEIYESWIEEEDERGMYFGPPTSETVITLKEVLHLPFSTGPDFGERLKLTIHKTE